MSELWIGVLVGGVISAAVTWLVAWYFYRRSTNDLTVEVAALKANQPTRLQPVECDELADLMSNATNALKNLSATGGKDAKIRDEARILQLAIYGWLSVNLNKATAEAFKGAAASPYVPNGMSQQHAGLYQIFQGQLNVLRDIARTACG